MIFFKTNGQNKWRKMMKSEGKMTRTAASRIQAAACKKSGGTTPAYSFASRAMSAAYKNEPLSSEVGGHYAANSSYCPCSCTLL